MIADSLSATAATAAPPAPAPPATIAAGPPAEAEGRAATAMSELTMGIVSWRWCPARFVRSAEEGGTADPLDVQLVGDQHAKDGEAVAHAAPEADLRRLFEVARGD